MAGAKGYSSYRGRGSKWKILLAILLVAVIAVAASVIYLEQFMVYSADGRRQIVLPWQTEARSPPWRTDREIRRFSRKWTLWCGSRKARCRRPSPPFPSRPGP